VWIQALSKHNKLLVSGRHVKGKSLLKDKDCIQIHDREFYFHARAQIEQSVSKVATFCCARIDSTILSQSAEVCVCVCVCVCVFVCVYAPAPSLMQRRSKRGEMHVYNMTL
jgi:hypothetical protein